MTEVTRSPRAFSSLNPPLDTVSAAQINRAPSVTCGRQARVVGGAGVGNSPGHEPHSQTGVRKRGLGSMPHTTRK